MDRIRLNFFFNKNVIKSAYQIYYNKKVKKKVSIVSKFKLKRGVFFLKKNFFKNIPHINLNSLLPVKTKYKKHKPTTQYLNKQLVLNTKTIICHHKVVSIINF